MPNPTTFEAELSKWQEESKKWLTEQTRRQENFQKSLQLIKSGDIYRGVGWLERYRLNLTGRPQSLLQMFGGPVASEYSRAETAGTGATGAQQWARGYRDIADFTPQQLARVTGLFEQHVSNTHSWRFRHSRKAVTNFGKAQWFSAFYSVAPELVKTGRINTTRRLSDCYEVQIQRDY